MPPLDLQDSFREVLKQISRLLDRGLIRPSTSPFDSPILSVNE